MAFHAVEARAKRLLRSERALAYEVSRAVVALPDGSEVLGIYSDFSKGHESEVRNVVLETVAEVAADGVTVGERDEFGPSCVDFWPMLGLSPAGSTFLPITAVAAWSA